MDLEQLQLILETAAEAGDGVFWLALFYIGSLYGRWISLMVIFGAGITVAYKLCKRWQDQEDARERDRKGLR